MSASKDKSSKFLLGLGKEISLPHIKKELITVLTSTVIFFIVVDFWFQCKNSRNRVETWCNVAEMCAPETGTEKLESTVGTSSVKITAINKHSARTA
jgi:hypothetical protein